MATVKELIEYIRKHDGVSVSSCEIADVKELNGLYVKKAWNRQGAARKHPCPPAKRPYVEAALRRFGMI